MEALVKAIGEVKGEVASSRQELKDHIEDENSLKDEMAKLNACMTKVTTMMEAIPQSQHIEQHAYVQQLIEEKRVRAAFWRDLRNKLATASILGALGLFGTAIWFLVKHWISTTTGVELPK